MAKKGTGIQSTGKAHAKESAKCLEIAEQGITTAKQYAQMMSALMTDLIVGSITPQIGNAVCNAGGKMLKVVELQLKYGKTSTDGSLPQLKMID
jgi:hypothetical protein